MGTLIVDQEGGFLVAGYNGFPRGADDKNETRWSNRDLKLKLVVHSEANAISQAARKGIELKNSKAYVCHLPTCTHCAALLIQAGITEVIVEAGSLTVERWLPDWELAKQIYQECNVALTILPPRSDNRDE